MSVEYFVDLIPFHCTRRVVLLLDSRTRGTFFFSITKWVITLSHSFALHKFLLDKLETLQPIRQDFALYSGVCAIFLRAVEPELWHDIFVVRSFFQSLLAHHIHCCIHHSVICLLFMFCMNDNHEYCAISLNEHNIV